MVDEIKSQLLRVRTSSATTPKRRGLLACVPKTALERRRQDIDLIA